ncbi:MAG TPA: DUF1585 domain-containing protein [Kofleriaceae bacterium]|nr:DUF1585 domain-containing protein [Kofleriaceae bacterium]
MSSLARRCAAVSALTLLACTEQPAPPLPTSSPLVLLSPVERLARASLAVRGYRPSLAELEAVAADPDRLAALVDEYLRAPEFGDTIRDLHNDTLLMDLEAPKFIYPNLGPFADATYAQLRAIMQEPLRLIEHVVVTGRPYTEIVTAPYTMANGTVATAFGLPHAGAAEVWEVTAWPDGRPAAGILASNALYQRHVSAGDNYHRGRANLISRALLCHDYLDSDVVLDTTINLADPEVVAEAVTKNPSCASCHQTLDPLASYFFTFAPKDYPNAITRYPYSGYKPRFAEQWRTTNKRPPMYFGAAPQGLAGLARAIADDPRFARCAAQRFTSHLTQVPIEDLDPALIARLQTAFVDSGYDARALVRAIVLSDAFAVSHTEAAEAADSTVGLLRMRPRQLARTLLELTGERWSTLQSDKISGVPLGPVDLLDNDTIGYRVLGGGMDSYYVTRNQTTMGATSALVSRRAAMALADRVVEHDRTSPATERRLFLKAEVTDAAEPMVRSQLRYLLARTASELVAEDDPRVDEAYAMFRDLLAQSGSAVRAWKLTLAGLFADSRALYY